MSTNAEGLAGYTHGLRYLSLENCNLSPRAMQAIFEAFNKNYGLSCSIKELYLGGNNFVDLGTAQLIKVRRNDLNFLSVLTILSSPLLLFSGWIP